MTINKVFIGLYHTFVHYINGNILRDTLIDPTTLIIFNADAPDTNFLSQIIDSLLLFHKAKHPNKLKKDLQTLIKTKLTQNMLLVSGSFQSAALSTIWGARYTTWFVDGGSTPISNLVLTCGTGATAFKHYDGFTLKEDVSSDRVPTGVLIADSIWRKIYINSGEYDYISLYGDSDDNVIVSQSSNEIVTVDLHNKVLPDYVRELFAQRKPVDLTTEEY